MSTTDDEVYVNEECPEECDQEHEVEREFLMECPATGNRWRYCARCGWEQAGRYDDEPQSVNGEILCEPYEHGYTSCEDCGDWVDEYAVHYAEDSYGDSYPYCESCFEDHAGRTRNGERLSHCNLCNTPRVHVCELTEEFLCDCRADESRKAKRPVLWMGEQRPSQPPTGTNPDGDQAHELVAA